jgi:isopentenyl-diphosphate delta-isomerase
MTPEPKLVELVSPDGEPVGQSTVDDAHTPPGQLHRAFSVLLFDDGGRTLLQQRSGDKSRFPLFWANTCCGHPAPGESVVAAAARRLASETGIRINELAEVGVYTYRAEDPATGTVECEYDHVVVGRWPVNAEIAPDPAEVAAVRWASAAELAIAFQTVDDDQKYAPWFRGVLSVALGSGLPPQLR